MTGPNKMGEPRAYYTKLSKSERERQTSYINVYTYMESRAIRSHGTDEPCLQGSNADANTEDRHRVGRRGQDELRQQR